MSSTVYKQVVKSLAPLMLLMGDETVGATSLVDSSGNGLNTGTLGSGITCGVTGPWPGDVGTCLQFDGTVNAVAAFAAGLSFTGKSEFTASFVVHVATADVGQRPLYTIGNTGSPSMNAVPMPWSDSTMYFTYGTTTSSMVTYAYGPKLDSWHHIIIRCSADPNSLADPLPTLLPATGATIDKLDIWIDGVQVATHIHGNAIPQGILSGGYIGRGQTGYGINWKGKLAGFAVWDRYLDDARVAAIYDAYATTATAVTPGGKTQYLGQLLKGQVGNINGNGFGKSFDGNVSTRYEPATSATAWLGIDLGVTQAPDYHGIQPLKPGNFDTAPETIPDSSGKTVGIALYSGDTAFASTTLQDTVNYDAVQLEITKRAVPASQSKRWWKWNVFDGKLASNLTLWGPYNSRIYSKAIAPTFSPLPGEYSTATPITISSETTGVPIYYTIDGTTPTSASTLYTTPITVADNITIKAIAIGGGIVSSDVSSGLYRYGQKQFDATKFILDDSGQRLQSFAGDMLYANGIYYWYGMWMRTSNPGLDPSRFIGTSVYSSTDLKNWHREGFAVIKMSSGADSVYTGTTAIGSPTITGLSSIFGLEAEMYVNGTGVAANSEIVSVGASSVTLDKNCTANGTVSITFGHTHHERVHVRYNPTTLKYVLWTRNPTRYDAQCFTSDTPIGPFTRITRTIPGGEVVNDMNFFVDTDGTSGYIIFKNAGGDMQIYSLNANWTDVVALVSSPAPLVGTGREAPVLTHIGNKYQLFTSVGNYYDSTSTFSPKVTTCDTLTGTWSALAYFVGSTPSDPVGTIYNAQPTAIFKLPTYDNAYMYISDRWVAMDLYANKHILLPIKFTDPANPIATTIDKWDVNDYFNSSSSASVGWPWSSDSKHTTTWSSDSKHTTTWSSDSKHTTTWSSDLKALNGI